MMKMRYNLRRMVLALAWLILPVNSLAVTTDAARIVFVTDVHTRSEWDTPEALRQCTAAINAQKPDLVVGGGDYITEGYESSQEKAAARARIFRENMRQRLEARFEPAIGNHDLVAVEPQDGSPASPEPRADFLKEYGLTNTYRAFDCKGIHFVLLDAIEISTNESRYVGHVDERQLNWLKADLAAIPTGMPVVVVTHIPLKNADYEARTNPPVSRIMINRTDVWTVLKGYNVMAVLQGHLHFNSIEKMGQILTITCGAVCGQWWRGPWQGTPEGFGVLTVRDGAAQWQYFDYGWKAQRPPNQ